MAVPIMASYIINLKALEDNARQLRVVADAAGCRMVLALKGFSTWPAFQAVTPWLDGCCASGLWEAELALDHFGGNILTYSPAYDEGELGGLLDISHHLDFNSIGQWNRFRERCLAHPRYRSDELSFGLRVNPQCSTGHTALYDPCVPGSRLGIIAPLLTGEDLTGISGLHMHTLCEQGAEDLEVTLRALEERFADLLTRPEITWVNLGGGHWITKPDYNRDLLIKLVRQVRDTYGVEVWLEPGEAVAIHTGVLRCKVLDVFESEGFHHAILDVSASAHMPDVLEMPYRPDVFQVVPAEEGGEALPAVVLEGEGYLKAELPGRNGRSYRLGAPTCLSGDVIGDFSFDRPLECGDELVFDDMAHYTMVKTTYFNGVRHPSIVLQHQDGRLETVRQFTYNDYKTQLG